MSEPHTIKDRTLKDWFSHFHLNACPTHPLESAPHVLKNWLILFTETKNPLYAWRAFQHARNNDLALPEDVLTYLDGVADKISKISNDPPAPKDRPGAVAVALGLGKRGAGQGSPFGEYLKRKQRLHLAIQTYKKVRSWGKNKFDYAFDEVAEETGVSKSTVRRNFQEHVTRWREKAEALYEEHETVLPNFYAGESGAILQDDDGAYYLQFLDEDEIWELIIIMHAMDVTEKRKQK